MRINRTIATAAVIATTGLALHLSDAQVVGHGESISSVTT